MKNYTESSCKKRNIFFFTEQNGTCQNPQVKFFLFSFFFGRHIKERKNNMSKTTFPRRLTRSYEARDVIVRLNARQKRFHFGKYLLRLRKKNDAFLNTRKIKKLSKQEREIAFRDWKYHECVPCLFCSDQIKMHYVIHACNFRLLCYNGENCPHPKGKNLNGYYCHSMIHNDALLSAQMFWSYWIHEDSSSSSSSYITWIPDEVIREILTLIQNTVTVQNKKKK
jgi:hypothetical protein